MDRKDILDRVVKVTCDLLGVDEGLVTPDSNFVFDLGAESAQSVQLVASFEQEFDVEMDNEAALKVQTVGMAVDFIAACLAGRK